MTMQEKEYFFNWYCKLKDNTLTIYDLSKPRVVPEVIKSLDRAFFKFKHSKIIIDFKDIKIIYPYPSVPLSAIFKYFKNRFNIEFEFINVPKYLETIKFENPLIPDESEIEKGYYCLGKIWKFETSKEINLIIKGILSSLRKITTCNEGVLQACEWGLFEIMDNVFHHSGQNTGYMMAQLLNERKRLSVCIFDYGIGIYNSIKDSANSYLSPADAISLALKKGKKGKESSGQGKGMWGLLQIISESNGDLSIFSGLGGLRYKCLEKKIENYKNLVFLDKNNQTTSVYFSLDLNNQLELTKVLDIEEYIDLTIQSFEDENDNIVFNVAEQGTGTGTRDSGFTMRNEVMNLNKQAQKPVIIDFNNVGLISSSYADEFIAKLFIEIGFINFCNNIRIKNLNNINKSILQNSFKERVQKEFSIDTGNKET